MKTLDYVMLLAIFNFIGAGYILGGIKGVAVTMIMTTVIVLATAPFYFSELRK